MSSFGPAERQTLSLFAQMRTRFDQNTQSQLLVFARAANHNERLSPATDGRTSIDLRRIRRSTPIEVHPS